MILVNTNYIDDKKLQTLTIVKGSIVWSKHIGKDILSGFKTLVGGEIEGYTEIMKRTEEDRATKRMSQEAEALGADAVVNIRYATSAIMQGQRKL